MRILCVKWGDKYGPEYVEKLKAACERHIPHTEFLCITENPVQSVKCHPLICDLPGWWQKIGLFRPGFFEGPNLYLDLDVVITSSIDEMLEEATSRQCLYALDDFSYSLVNPKKGMDSHTKKLLGGIGTINSSVMFWDGNKGSAVDRVWDKFTPEIMDELHGDQNWITQALWPGGIKLWPSGFVKSYKYGNRQPAPIVVFHGDPKPHQVNDEWVLKNW